MQPAELDVPRGDVQRRPSVPAGWAAIVAEVADVGGGEVVRRSAAEAVLRVGRVLEMRPGVARVVEAEAERRRASVGEIRRRRVVRVHDERRVDGKARRRRRASARRRARARRSGRAGRGRGCRGRRTRGRIRASASGSAASSTSNRPSSARRAATSADAIPERRFAPARFHASASLVAEDLGRHRGRRGLPVGRGDERDAVRQPGGERVDRCRGRASRAPFRGSSCRRRARPHARARRAHARRSSRG